MVLTEFAGLTTTATAPNAISSDGKIRTRKEVKTANGLLANVTDATGGVITYQYDAFGNLARVTTTGGTDGKTSTITNSYDLRGRKIARSQDRNDRSRHGRLVVSLRPLR